MIDFEFLAIIINGKQVIVSKRYDRPHGFSAGSSHSAGNYRCPLACLKMVYKGYSDFNFVVLPGNGTILDIAAVEFEATLGDDLDLFR